MTSITVHCPRCQLALVYRHGQSPKGRDRFRSRELLALLTPFTIGMLTTDEWGSYTRELPKENGVITTYCNCVS
ncbi:IS1 family transposase [Escherichia albertii]|nr:IS1 family transposase [Escherichia albertii]